MNSLFRALILILLLSPNSCGRSSQPMDVPTAPGPPLANSIPEDLSGTTPGTGPEESIIVDEPWTWSGFEVPFPNDHGTLTNHEFMAGAAGMELHETIGSDASPTLSLQGGPQIVLVDHLVTVSAYATSQAYIHDLGIFEGYAGGIANHWRGLTGCRLSAKFSIRRNNVVNGAAVYHPLWNYGSCTPPANYVSVRNSLSGLLSGVGPRAVTDLCIGQQLVIPWNAPPGLSLAGTVEWRVYGALRMVGRSATTVTVHCIAEGIGVVQGRVRVGNAFAIASFAVKVGDC